MMNTLLMNLREGLITPHKRVTFEIQFMLRSQQFKIIAFHISYGDITGSGRLVQAHVFLPAWYDASS